MTTAEMAAYAYDQIDQARAALTAVSEETTSATRGSSSQKHVYPVTGPDPPMCEVGAFGRSNGHMWCTCAH